MAASVNSRPAHYVPNWIGFGVLVVLVLAVNLRTYMVQRQEVIDRNTERLAQLAKIKTQQIEDRLTEWQRVAQAEAGDPEIPVAVYQAENRPDDRRASGRNFIHEHADAWRRVHSLRSVVIVDRQMAALVVAGKEINSADLHKLSASASGGADSFAVLPAIGYDSVTMTLGIFAPLRVPGKREPRLVGYLVFAIDVGSSILPLLDWDVGEGSAEFLLLNKEGDRVGYIGGMKHQRSPNTTQYRTLSSPNLAAAKVFSGTTSGSDVLDYRGVPVVFDARPVRGTPWYLLAKIDQDELLIPARRVAWIYSGVLMVAVTLLAFIALGMIRTGRAEYLKYRTERKLTHLVDSAKDAILLVDQQQRIVLFNPAAETVFRRSARDTLGSSLSVLVPEVQRATHEEHFERFMKTGVSLRSTEQLGELPALRGDGSTFAAEISIARMSDGVDTYCSAIVRDVSERKAVEEQLRLSEDRFRGYLERAPIGIMIVDHLGIVVECNAVARALFGHDEPISVPAVFLAIFSVAGREIVLADILFLAVGAQIEREFQLTRLRAQSVWIRMRAIKLADGRVMIYCEDVSERKSVELALRESERRFRSIFDNLPIAAAIHQLLFDADGKAIDYRLVGLNPAFERHTGLVATDALGADATTLFGGGEAPNIDIYAQVVKTGVPALFGTYLPAIERYVEISACRVFEDMFVVTFADVTAQKLARELEKRRAEEMVRTSGVMVMGEMATAVAHEVSQPLTSIANYSEGCLSRLDKGPLPAETLRDVLVEISREAARAGNVLREIRRLVQSHEFRPQREDLQEMIRGIAAFDDFRRSKFIPQVRMELGAEPLPVEADRVLIEIVLLNLIRNAADAMSDPQLTQRELFIRARRIHAGMAEVSVSDTGTGIASADLEKIFDPRFSTKREGIGMGLAITRSIVEIHGGRIWAGNNAGGGATIYFTLPLIEE